MWDWCFSTSHNLQFTLLTFSWVVDCTCSDFVLQWLEGSWSWLWSAWINKALVNNTNKSIAQIWVYICLRYFVFGWFNCNKDTFMRKLSAYFLKYLFQVDLRAGILTLIVMRFKLNFWTIKASRILGTCFMFLNSLMVVSLARRLSSTLTNSVSKPILDLMFLPFVYFKKVQNLRKQRIYIFFYTALRTWKC